MLTAHRDIDVGVDVALGQGFGVITGRPDDDLSKPLMETAASAGGSDQQSSHTDSRDEGPEESEVHAPQR